MRQEDKYCIELEEWEPDVDEDYDPRNEPGLWLNDKGIWCRPDGTYVYCDINI